MENNANTNTRPGTGEVAARFGLTEGQVNTILRRRGEIRPPVVGRRRRWRPEDIAALARYLQTRQATTVTTTSPSPNQTP